MTSLENVVQVLGYAGLVYVLYKVTEAIFAGYKFFLRPAQNLRKRGEWAIVTGATDGIGRGYAFELARQGLSVLLISRTEAKLEEVAKDIKAKYPKVSVSHLAVDYSNFNAAARETVAKKIKDLDVGVLVNNVGMSYPFTRYFHELSESEVDGLVELNINSTVWMTKLVLGDLKPDGVKGMLSRRRGAIVNTSSGAGRTISPLLAEYSGAKSFIEMFSKGMKAELAPFNIHVQAQAPLFVATKLAKIKKTSLTVPSPAAYARSAVAHIGFEDSVSPYWSHALQLWAMRIIPEALSTSIVHKMHLGIWKKGCWKEQNKSN